MTFCNFFFPFSPRSLPFYTFTNTQIQKQAHTHTYTDPMVYSTFSFAFNSHSLLLRFPLPLLFILHLYFSQKFSVYTQTLIQKAHASTEKKRASKQSKGNTKCVVFYTKEILFKIVLYLRKLCVRATKGMKLKKKEKKIEKIFVSFYYFKSVILFLFSENFK